jgi:hypothetical protein
VSTASWSIQVASISLLTKIPSAFSRFAPEDAIKPQLSKPRLCDLIQALAFDKLRVTNIGY